MQIKKSWYNSSKTRRRNDSPSWINKRSINRQKSVGATMPTISMFYGIIILMYFYDDKRHNVPHIHAEYAEHEASIAIEDGEVLSGSLPTKKLKLIQAWIEIHKDELLANWKLAVAGEPIFKIEPLR